ncbi:hypothetical protein BKA03_001540 [Demequina lutea]|uniref:Uncharacterized protein n=1 Tax=Demequina lutea TaxID=431489 RepID=A0A7Y9ZA53_9MICO|nr:hypothetical protein [Demequina lutea]
MPTHGGGTVNFEAWLTVAEPFVFLGFLLVCVLLVAVIMVRDALRGES